MGGALEAWRSREDLSTVCRWFDVTRDSEMCTRVCTTKTATTTATTYSKLPLEIPHQNKKQGRGHGTRHRYRTRHRYNGPTQTQLHPPRAACEPAHLCIPLACCLFSCFIALLLRSIFYFEVPRSIILFLFLAFFDFDLDVVLFHPVFFLWVLCCLLGFCCDSFSI